MLTVRKYTINDSLLAEAGFSVRRSVFVEEQNVLPDEEFEFEDESVHFLLFYQEVPVATARWRVIENSIKLERFAVLKNYRNLGLGSIILQTVLNDLKGRPEPIYLHSQLKALPFYERAGFVRKGDIFSECDILHYKMVYKPSVIGSLNETIHQAYDHQVLMNDPVNQHPVAGLPSTQVKKIQKHFKEAAEAYTEAVRNGDVSAVSYALAEQLYALSEAVNSHGLQENIMNVFRDLHLSRMKELPGKGNAGSPFKKIHIPTKDHP